MGDAYDESLVSKEYSLNIVSRELFAHVYKDHITEPIRTEKSKLMTKNREKIRRI